MPVHIKFLLRFLICSVLFVSLGNAEEIEIKVSKIASNLYVIEEKPILIQTHNCDAVNDNQSPFLRINERSKKIIFHKTERTCEVKAAYKRSSEGVGSYSVIIHYDTENWYAISSTDSYIRTKQCASRTQGEKAVLSLSGTGFGTLHIHDLECWVEGVYTQIE